MRLLDLILEDSHRKEIDYKFNYKDKFRISKLFALINFRFKLNYESTSDDTLCCFLVIFKRLINLLKDFQLIYKLVNIFYTLKCVYSSLNFTIHGLCLCKEIKIN